VTSLAPFSQRADDHPESTCPPTQPGEVVVPLGGRSRRFTITRDQRREDAVLDRYCAAPWCDRVLRDTDPDGPYCPGCQAMIKETEEE
jgi:hypothetical protein